MSLCRDSIVFTCHFDAYFVGWKRKKRGIQTFPPNKEFRFTSTGRPYSILDFNFEAQ